VGFLRQLGKFIGGRMLISGMVQFDRFFRLVQYPVGNLHSGGDTFVFPLLHPAFFNVQDETIPV
jgi:hypothetical protein